ncbi:MAG: hypothetical protein EXQ58_03980 [Acidobacteria bacterium]|nr:hypothetical protein [Acidobacteriota bacterium]
MALRGADLVVLPTNWPTGAEEFTEYLVNARSLKNHTFSAAINRVGEERGFRFIGRSRILDVTGRTLGRPTRTRKKSSMPRLSRRERATSTLSHSMAPAALRPH